jgi:hypothetical protein
LGNREQNRQFRAAVREIERIIERELTLEERDRLHREVRGQNYSFDDIVAIGVAMFG